MNDLPDWMRVERAERAVARAKKRAYVVLSVNVEPDVARRLRGLADYEGVTLSVVLRKAIDAYLEAAA